MLRREALGAGIVLLSVATVVMAASSTAAPGADLVLSAVAPSVSRALRDGAGHDLGTESGASSMVKTPEGTWLVGPELFRLGRPGLHHTMLAGDRWSGDATASPDGTIWVADGGGLWSFRQGKGTMEVPIGSGITAVAAAPDGSVWVADAVAASRVSGSERRAWPFTDMPRLAAVDGLRAWGLAKLAVTADGQVYLGLPEGGLARFDGTTWQAVDPLGDGLARDVRAMAAGPDGGLVAALVGPTGPLLARWDGTSWNVASEGVPDIGVWEGYRGHMAVDGDGVVWLGGVPFDAGRTGDRGGVAAFDGRQWEWFGGDPWLAAVSDLSIGPDGEVYVLGSTSAHDTFFRGLHVIERP